MRRLLLAAILVLGVGVPGHVEARAPRRGPRLGAMAAPVRLVSHGSALAVAGLHSYFGQIELDAASDGMVVVNRLPLERYLLGLQEVPPSWPLEALKAQAVAARTYALWTLGRPRAGAAAVHGFDICATVECQVFAGADVVLQRDGLRWARAVAATVGEAVLYRGRPILARYHSTSGGRTFDNAQIYTDEPNYPYLRGVKSTTEERSPLYRWEVRLSVRRLERMLRVAGRWRGEGRLLGARTVPSASERHYPDVEYIGRKGSVTTTAEELRVLLRTAAPQIFPGRYPSRWPTSSGRLPETLPSNRVEISTRAGVVRIEGRGWGHGVGMSQWGAEGLARRGAGYRDILAHYYRSITIGRARNPGIRVGIAWGRRAVTVHGDFSLADGTGRTLVEHALGTWTFRWAGPGTLAVDPPVGLGLPLEVAIVAAPRQIEAGERAYLTIALSRPARVGTVTASAGPSADPGARVKDAGRRRVPWPAPLRPGRYEVSVRAKAGPRRRQSESVEIIVVSPEKAEGHRGDAGRGAGGGAGRVVLPAVALALLLAVILGGAMVGTSRIGR